MAVNSGVPQLVNFFPPSRLVPCALGLIIVPSRELNCQQRRPARATPSFCCFMVQTGTEVFLTT